MWPGKGNSEICGNWSVWWPPRAAVTGACLTPLIPALSIRLTELVYVAAACCPPLPDVEVCVTLPYSVLPCFQSKENLLIKTQLKCSFNHHVSLKKLRPGYISRVE